MSDVTATDDRRALRWGTTSRLTALAAAVLGVMWYRRPDQFTHPYIWVEDGTSNLPDFIAHGWGFVVQPIVGYICVPIRVLFGIAASTSFRWLPELSFALALLFTYGVLVAIALSPLALRHRFLCALAVLVVPTNPEVFGVSLYTGWWGSVLVLLPLLWPVAFEGQLWLRSGLLALGGLSTPLCVGLLPFYAVRWAWWRQRSDRWLLLLCGVVSTVQLATMWSAAAALGGRAASRWAINLPMKFFGYYLLWTPARPDQRLYLSLGLVLIAILAVASFLQRRTLGWTWLVLVGSLSVTILLAAVRAPLDVMHPTLAGGRYFFLPYLLLSWLLLQMIDWRYQATSVFCAAALLLSVGGFVAHGRWRHAPIDWRANLDQCVDEPMHRFWVHYEGTQPHRIIWTVEVPGEACRRLVQQSLFDNQLHQPLPADR